MAKSIDNHISSNNPRCINIPNFFYIGNGMIDDLEHILSKEGIKIDGALIISGNSYTAEIADSIAARMSHVRRLRISSNDIDAIQGIEKAIEDNDTHLVIAVGGGKVIDTVKYACSRLSKPVLVIPTTLSNDGISSPVSVVSIVNVDSIGVRPPIGIVIDIGIVKKAPKHTILSGIGDLISNISAVEDWRLAHEYTSIHIDRFAEIVSRNAAERFIYYVLKNRRTSSSSRFSKEILQNHKDKERMNIKIINNERYRMSNNDIIELIAKPSSIHATSTKPIKVETNLSYLTINLLKDFNHAKNLSAALLKHL